MESVKRIKSLLEIKKYIDNYSVFIFDLDDTLFSEKEYIRSGYHQIAEKVPQIPDMYDKLLNAYNQGKSAIDEVLKDEGIYTEELKAMCLGTYRNQIPDIHMYDEAREILQYIKNAGKKLGLITDGRPEGQRAKINVLKLEEIFDKIIVTDELGGPDFRKPCSKAYELMQDFFGVPYGEMVYIGDNTTKDFIAPEKLGMGAIWFDNEDGIYRP